MDGASKDTDTGHGEAFPGVETLIRDARSMAGSNGGETGALERLVAHVERTSEEIAALSPDSIARKHIPVARNELDALCRDLADAAHRIMDCADALLSETFEDAETYRAAVHGHAIRIMEACIFNDLAGQRLSKAGGVLSTVEARLLRLTNQLGSADQPESETADERRSRELILNGPALSLSSVHQNDIDKMFDLP